MGLKEPVGQRLKFWGQEGRIIGVVKDFHHVSLHREILPQVFTINPRFYASWIKYIFIKVSPGGLPETLRAIRESSREIRSGLSLRGHVPGQRSRVALRIRKETGQDFHRLRFPGRFHLLPGHPGARGLQRRAAHQGDRRPESPRLLGPGNRRPAFQAVLVVDPGGEPHRLAHRLLRDAQMAAGFRLPDRLAPRPVCPGRLAFVVCGGPPCRLPVAQGRRRRPGEGPALRIEPTFRAPEPKSCLQCLQEAQSTEHADAHLIPFTTSRTLKR